METCAECSATIEDLDTCWAMATPYCLACWETQQQQNAERGE